MKKLLTSTITKQKLDKDSSADLLYSQLFKIYEQIKREGKVEVFGNLDFEVVEKIDNKKQRIAKLKGNKILVKLNAVALPKSALKYIVAHEIAHTFTKRHTRKFWKIVETIYPNFEIGQRLFMKYGKFLS
jgi:predicted metal-dependent hydrolase